MEESREEEDKDGDGEEDKKLGEDMTNLSG